VHKKIDLSSKQQECIEFCLDKKRRLVAVSGEAGTGKTTIIRHLVERLWWDVSVVVAAPTGKAAKRVYEATGIRAVTLHKLLEFGRPRDRDKKTGEPTDTTRPRRCLEHPLEQQVVICDEYSMVTSELDRSLINALPRGGKLIMFGDISQLSPIEKYPVHYPESPFVRHLSNPNRAFTLEEVFRQEADSGVLNAAHAIRKGRIPRRSNEFALHVTDDPVNTLRRLISKTDTDFSSIHNQIISPVRGRWIGTGPLNIMLRNVYNPHGGDEMQLMRYPWDEKYPVIVSVGDKVVCTENTYDLRPHAERFSEWDKEGKPILKSFIPCPETKYMLNGETGKILTIFPDGAMEVDFGDRVVEIPYDYEDWNDKSKRYFTSWPQRTIELAYAITTHKAQGSEYDTVIYVMNKSIMYMLARENFYTGVTRARHAVHVITDSTALMNSLKITREVVAKRTAARDKKRGSMIKPNIPRR
jgi:exodeoxyribonuclease V alpha subunit